jgi:hypothetical protein
MKYAPLPGHRPSGVPRRVPGSRPREGRPSFPSRTSPRSFACQYCPVPTSRAVSQPPSQTTGDSAGDFAFGLPRWLGWVIAVIYLYGLINFAACCVGVILAPYSLDLGPAARVLAAGFPGFLLAWYAFVGSHLYEALLITRQGTT